MNIGGAASASGVSAKMIRYYESIGLIRPSARSEAGCRLYGSEDIHDLRFVKRARGLGFSVEEVGALLDLWRDTSRASADVKALAMRRVCELEARVAEMQALARTLRHLADNCSGDGRPDCPILDDLADATVARASADPSKFLLGCLPSMRGNSRIAVGLPFEGRPAPDPWPIVRLRRPAPAVRHATWPSPSASQAPPTRSRRASPCWLRNEGRGILLVPALPGSCGGILTGIVVGASAPKPCGHLVPVPALACSGAAGLRSFETIKLSRTEATSPAASYRLPRQPHARPPLGARPADGDTTGLDTRPERP